MSQPIVPDDRVRATAGPAIGIQTNSVRVAVVGHRTIHDFNGIVQIRRATVSLAEIRGEDGIPQHNTRCAGDVEPTAMGGCRISAHCTMYDVVAGPAADIDGSAAAGSAALSMIDVIPMKLAITQRHTAALSIQASATRLAVEQSIYPVVGEGRSVYGELTIESGQSSTPAMGPMPVSIPRSDVALGKYAVADGQNRRRCVNACTVFGLVIVCAFKIAVVYGEPLQSCGTGNDIPYPRFCAASPRKDTGLIRQLARQSVHRVARVAAHEGQANGIGDLDLNAVRVGAVFQVDDVAVVHGQVHGILDIAERRGPVGAGIGHRARRCDVVVRGRDERNGHTQSECRPQQPTKYAPVDLVTHTHTPKLPSPPRGCASVKRALLGAHPYSYPCNPRNPWSSALWLWPKATPCCALK